MQQRSLFGLVLAIGLSSSLPALPTETAREVSRFTWQEDDERFGGFSGLEIDPDGGGFMVLSDRGFFLRAALVRTADGKIADVRPGDYFALKPEANSQWPGRGIDSEGLAIAPDGTIYVSAEGIHQVFRFSGPDQPAQPLPRTRLFDRLIKNGSLESLAIGPDGALYTLPERSGRTSRPFPVFRLQNGRWDTPFSLPRLDEFLPVGMDFGPDGALYLLERRFSMLWGFSSRVRRFVLGDQKVLSGEVIFESPAGEYGNLEGISAWQDGDGNIRLIMISDDNFSFLQSTEIVEYLVGRHGVASGGEGG